MLTSNTSRDRVREARDIAVTEFLAKPLTAKSLYGRIVTIIESPRQFVRTAIYFGPDRRRAVREHPGVGRRHDDNGA